MSCILHVPESAAHGSSMSGKCSLAESVEDWHARSSESEGPEFSCCSSTMSQASSTTLSHNLIVSLQQKSEYRAQHAPRHEEINMTELIKDEIVLAPLHYLESLPSKGVRDLLADALNIWYQLPDTDLMVIKSIIAYLHNSSLMFDDIEDNSILRRGQPVTHAIFGVGQTVNSATYVLILAINEAHKLSSINARDVIIEGVLKMLIGQSADLSATRLMQCPNEEEYLTSVDNKTGALFQILNNVMLLESGRAPLEESSSLMTLFGRFFQIRDDYLNLVSSEYAGQKGFCEDLDEGKFSLPLIHCLSPDISAGGLSYAQRLELHNIFVSRNQTPTHTISVEMKHRVLEILRQRGSLEYTRSRLVQIEQLARDHIDRAEAVFGRRNELLRKLMSKLEI